MTDWAAELSLAVAAAEDAGVALLRHHRSRDLLHVEEKRAGDFVSEADREAEALLRRRLLGARPGDGWLGEETGEEAGNGRRWVVDPLDGTTNFLRGLPYWCVSVALEVEGRPRLGVIHDPLHGETFAAAPGLGFRLNGRLMPRGAAAALSSALFGTGIPFGGMAHIGDHAADLARLMPQCAGVRRTGASALDLAYVAAGRLDGFWERRLRPWDVAAGLALMAEAGVRVEGMAQSEDPWETGSVICAAPGLFDGFAALLRGGQDSRA
ncbi:inositol monophosphatase [Tabrizicola sp. TH137]|uniref:inositol monophosphatase family protein n=1 Tax=Tabrizicola sp. TH137 TaxID=2067452 RepID=UPI000C7DF8B3|nr:inositol monophosphatase [Tabrizicola sp. TH137]PLL14251.1 inositol monophosphatase [Tabrizicola sp. TH137]